MITSFLSLLNWSWLRLWSSNQYPAQSQNPRAEVRETIPILHSSIDRFMHAWLSYIWWGQVGWNLSQIVFDILNLSMIMYLPKIWKYYILQALVLSCACYRQTQSFEYYCLLVNSHPGLLSILMLFLLWTIHNLRAQRIFLHFFYFTWNKYLS